MKELKLKGNFRQELETERLVLKPWNLGFAKKMFENWASDPEVSKYLFWEPHKNAGETEEIIKLWMERINYNWCIVLKETGEPIGSIEAVKIDERYYKAEVGYCLSRRYWNKGIMTEALKKVIDFLFEEGFNKIELKHAIENGASGRVMQKAGMTFEGVSPQDCYAKGKFYDCNVYYILRSQYYKEK